jgi:predicted enzyme related to lactoylglutathione lyase
MAKRKTTRSSSKPKKADRKRAPSRRPKAASRSSRRAAPTRARTGIITHTELASTEPQATRAWCATVLGWQFGQAMPTPSGPYHMWRFANDTGGGIRASHPPEMPGSIPYCEVQDIRETYARALEEGAREMMAPAALPEGMGWIAIVAAPGGVPIGFWAMK